MLLNDVSALLRGSCSKMPWLLAHEARDAASYLQADVRLKKTFGKSQMIPLSGAREECYCITSVLKFVYAITHVSKT